MAVTEKSVMLTAKLVDWPAGYIVEEKMMVCSRPAALACFLAITVDIAKAIAIAKALCKPNF
jgi:hypothetical protein